MLQPAIVAGNGQSRIGCVFGFVPRNALGSRNASGRISREQTSERIVTVWGKPPEVVARLPIQIVNDKGTFASTTLVQGVQAESIVEEKTVGAAGRSRALWFLKSILALALAPIR